MKRKQALVWIMLIAVLLGGSLPARGDSTYDAIKARVASNRPSGRTLSVLPEDIELIVVPTETPHSSTVVDVPGDIPVWGGPTETPRIPAPTPDPASVQPAPTSPPEATASLGEGELVTAPPSPEETLMPPVEAVPPIAEDILLPVVPDDYEPATLALGAYEPPQGKAGEAITLVFPLDLLFDGQHYLSNWSAVEPDTEAYDPDAAPDVYDQTIAALLDYAEIQVADNQPDGLPLDTQVLTNVRVIDGGINRGYAVWADIPLAQEAMLGEHSLNLTLRWRENETDAQEQETHITATFSVLAPEATPEVTPSPEPTFDAESILAASVPVADGIVVYSYAELRQAITGGAYDTIYLGYDATNQGTIAFTDGNGTAIPRSLTIDGLDPLTGQRMHLKDWNSSGTSDGLYANAGGLTITLRNMDITIQNYYSIVYGSARNNITVNYENVAITGRQAAHNRGTNSVVTFTDCTINLSNIGTGGEQELAETSGVTFYGNNVIVRTGPQDNSLLWMTGTGSHTITIAEGADVSMTTTDYMIFDDTLQTTLDVYGTLRLTTTGSRGSVTFEDQYIRLLQVHDGGTLIIDHQNATRPTLQAATINIGGTLQASRTSSAYALIRLQAGGTMKANNPRLIDLENPGGRTIVGYGGTASLTWTTEVINRFTGGSTLATVWNNRGMASFTASMTVSATANAVSAVSGLNNGSRGDALGAVALQSGNINLVSDGRVRLGRSNLTVDTVYGGQTVVYGRSAAGVTQYLYEYDLVDGALGALIQQSQQVTSNGAGRFSNESSPFSEAIQPENSRIYVTSFDGMLESHTYTDPIAQSLSFLEIPGTMRFESVKLSGEDQRIPRELTDWAIQIFDPRDAGEGFALYAHIAQPLTSVEGDTLPGSLVFVQGGAAQPFTDADLLIARGSTSDGIHTYTVQWAADAGILVDLPAYTGVPNDPYSTTIYWTLVEGP